ncbi:MAG: hypothetical protein D6785_08015 [Planctomycetota bacterium]|nr:MAG: hypothetical protein D6785_08015 [Planctomycetota bacterium]
MTELLTPINSIAFSWKVFLPHINSYGFSHLLKTDEGCLLVDPLKGDREIFKEIESIGKPDGIVILNQHHWRDGEEFASYFKAPIFLSNKAPSELQSKANQLIENGKELPGGFQALDIGQPTSSEMALIGWRTLVFGDCLVNIPSMGGVMIIPEQYAPQINRLELKKTLKNLLVYQFETLLFGHGPAVQSGALETLCQILEKNEN